jgi:magnesium chelatase subunit D
MAARGSAAQSSRGRASGVQTWDGHSHHVALVASVAAALRNHRGTPVRLEAPDLRMHRRRSPSQRLVLLLVDGSGSMGAQDRMARTKAGLRSILDRLYVRRDRVALQVFRNRGTELLVPPGRNLGAAHAAVEALPTGGGTPLAGALHAASALLQRVARTHLDASRMLVLITDGRTREDVRDGAIEVAEVADQRLIIDTEAGAIRLGRARQLAQWLDAQYEALG